MTIARDGVLSGSLPCRAAGNGPPVVVLRALPATASPRQPAEEPRV